jgi:hypothetical protein
MAVDVARLSQALSKSLHEIRRVGRRPAVEKPNQRHRRLLRAHCQWPRNGRTAEKRDELAPLQLIELH